MCNDLYQIIEILDIGYQHKKHAKYLYINFKLEFFF